MSKKVALYARVSTLLGQDPENQLVHLRQLAKTKGLSVHAEYVDLGISGSKERRPALDKMLADAKAGKFDVVLITALDRISRDTRHLLNLVHGLREINVSIVSQRENIDMDGPLGAAFLAIMGAIATLEKDLTRERIKNALAAKKKTAEATGNGWRCGRPTSITPALLNEIKIHRSAGHGSRTIERLMSKRVSRATIDRVVRTLPQNPPQIAPTRTEGNQAVGNA